MKKSLGRRQLLRGGVAATLGVVATGFAGESAGETPGAAASSEPSIQKYPVLGRTGLKMSDISFGSGGTADPKVVRYAFDRGINYFDTAESYPLGAKGAAETAIGQALKGVRNQIILTSKTMAGPNARQDQLMARLNETLARLQTDHVDIYLNHAVNDVARVTNPEWAEFTARAKKDGKIRFSGMSGHGGNLLECLNVGLDKDLFDVILVAYNFGQDPKFYERLTKNFDMIANQKGLPKVLKKAKEKNVGVVAMKTLMGARLNDMRPYEWDDGTFAQAAFRWTLSNPDVDGLIVSMGNKKQIDEYVAASGESGVRKADLELLDRYATLNASTYCRFGCNDCESSCPSNVPISEVLRSRMYAADYGDSTKARVVYARLGDGASACLQCKTEDCLQGCSYGVKVSALTRSTPGLLTPV